MEDRGPYADPRREGGVDGWIILFNDVVDGVVEESGLY